MAEDAVASAYVELRPEMSRFGQEAKTGILGTIGRVGAAASGLLIGFRAFDFVKSSVIDFNSTLQQTRVAFTNLYGSGAKANEVMGQLQDFAKTTPYDFETLIPVAQQLVGSLGKSADLIPIMTHLGDAVAATGGSGENLRLLTLAYSQLATSGTAHLGDLMQINNAVPGSLSRMAAAGGMSIGEFRDKVSKGLISSQEAVKLFNKVTTDKKFGIAGGMEAQSHTFAGAMSNIHDALQQGLAGAGQAIFSFVSRVAIGIGNVISIFQGEGGGMAGIEAVLQHIFGDKTGYELMAPLTQAISIGQQAIGLLKDAISAGFGIIQAVIVGAVTFIAAHMDQIKTAFGAVRSVIETVAGFISAHADLFKTLAIGIGIVTGALFALAAILVVVNGLMAVAFSPVILVVVALGLLVGALIYAYQHFEAFRDVVQTAVKVTIAVIRWFVDTAIAIWQRIGPTIIALTVNAFHTVMGIVRGALEVIHGIIDVVMGLIHGDWGRVWNGIKEIVMGVWHIILAYLRGAVGAALIVAEAIGRAILNGIIRFVQSIPGRVESLISSAVGAVRGLIGAAAGAAAALGSAILNGIVNLVKSIPGKVRSLLGGLAGVVRGLAGSVLSAAEAIGQAIWNGIKNGIGDLAGKLKSTVENGLSSGLGKLNPFSPVEHGGAKYIGEPIVRGAVSAIMGLGSATSAAIEGQLRSALQRPLGAGLTGLGVGPYALPFPGGVGMATPDLAGAGGVVVHGDLNVYPARFTTEDLHETVRRAKR